MRGDPTTQYGWILDALDSDCSVFECWDAAVLWVRAVDGRCFQVCSGHAFDHKICHEIVATTGD